MELPLLEEEEEEELPLEEDEDVLLAEEASSFFKERRKFWMIWLTSVGDLVLLLTTKLGWSQACLRRKSNSRMWA